MKMTVNGAAIPVVVVVLAVGAVCAAGGFVGGMIYANRNKGGLGDGSSLGVESQPDTPIEPLETDAETVPDTTEEATEPLTEPETSSHNAIDVTVSGNTYLYLGEEFDLTGILAILRINKELPVTVADDNASLKAYNELIYALDKLEMHYYEASE